MGVANVPVIEDAKIRKIRKKWNIDVNGEKADGADSRFILKQGKIRMF